MKFENVTAQQRRSQYANLRDKVWLENEFLRAWLVADPALMSDILRAPDMALPGIEGMVSHIEQRSGKSLSYLRRAANMIPIMHSGETHAALRRALAVYLMEKAKAATTVLPPMISTFLKRFQIKGSVDVHHDVVEPMIEQFISFLVGKPVPPEILGLRLDLVLNHSKSPSLVMELDRCFAIAIRFLEDDCTDELDLACKICCITFGAETLIMMLVECTLYAVEIAGDGPAYLPDFPHETGVPLTWRLATKDVSIGGCPVRAGDTVKLRLQVAAYADKPEIINLIFGAGPHSCIGKNVSLILWEHFSVAFNAMQLHAKHGAYDSIVEPHMIRYRKAEIEIR